MNADPDPLPSTPTSDTTPHEVEASEQTSSRSWHRTMFTLLGIAAGVLLLDQVVKALMIMWLTDRPPVQIIGDLLQFRLIRNSGAAFSMATGATWLLTLVATVVVVVIVRLARKITSLWWTIGLGLLLGGALGNLFDRYFREPGFAQGHVIDFIQVKYFAIFNLADVAITCAAIIIVALGLFGIGLDGKKIPRDSKKSKQDNDSPSDSAPVNDDASRSDS